MSSEQASIESRESAGQPPAPDPESQPSRRFGPRRVLLSVIAAVVVLDIVAALFLAPAGFPGPRESIRGNLELIPPAVVWDLAPRGSEPTGALVVDFHPSITSSILVSWIVMAIMIVFFVGGTRALKYLPGRVQNAVEYVYALLEDFAIALGGEPARPYVGIFATLFVFIALANWTDLLIFGDKVNVLRTPTSDINVTIGLALFSFVLFHFEGVRRLGARTYLGKFFNFRGFRRSFVDGLIDLFVGLIEFLLEFFKPVTLAFRLFGNLYGGGVMLGVFTALLLAVLPLPFVALEAFIGFVQALIFSVLTLMFTLIAIEGPHEEAHSAPETAREPQGRAGPPLAASQAGEAG